MAYSAGLWYLIEQEKRENMYKNNIVDYEDLYNTSCEKYIPKIQELEKENKNLKRENEKLKEKLLFYKWRWKQNKFGGWYFEVKKPKDIQN